MKDIQFYTISEIAKLCKLSERTILRQIEAGKLIARRLGGQWRIEEADFYNWLNQGNITSENALIAPNHSDQVIPASPQPEKSIPQTKIKPGKVDSGEGNSGKYTDVKQEKTYDEEVAENAEKFVAYWNQDSTVKYKLTLDGHLHQSIKHTVERLITENNDDLKDCLLTMRIFFYFCKENLLKLRRPLTIRQYIQREFPLILNYPNITEAEEKQLEPLLIQQDITCNCCGLTTRIEGPLEKRQCPNPKCCAFDVIVSDTIIEVSDIINYPALQLFYHKYKPLIQVEDWSMVRDLYKIKKEIYNSNNV
jgi:excisionase family DNA binding protein